MSTLQLALWSLACAVPFTLCDALATWSTRTGSRLGIVATCLLAPTSYLAFGLLAARTELWRVGGLVNAMIVLLTTLASVVVFQERLAPSQFLGIVLVGAGVYLLSRPS
jgi:drug/metabolite transporter (DMT)-like permease